MVEGKKRGYVFISYSRKDSRHAVTLEKQLKKRGLRTWRDIRDVDAGVDWWAAIDEGVRQAQAVVVLISKNSMHSDWVTYEYGLATGARVPIVAVALSKSTLPRPMSRFHPVPLLLSHSEAAAEKIHRGIPAQIQSLAKADAFRKRPATPTALARFSLEDGKMSKTSRATNPPMLAMELWLEEVPSQTSKVSFEILDEGVRDNVWSLRKSGNNTRQFLTDDINLYGDVEILIRGTGRREGDWAMSTTLYEALDRYYQGSRFSSPAIRAGLAQIRNH